MSQVHPPSSSLRRRLTRAISVVLAIGAALGIAEGAVRLIRNDAFPFLNLFVADADFGVRLKANACSRTRTRVGRVTTACTNAEGFRGPTWNDRADARVVIVGDSQVFGYAVDDGQTFPAQLQTKLGSNVDVVNLGVPTWGPKEYVAAAKAFGARREISHLVIVINAANDFFESNVENRRRMTAENGFAKRVHGSSPKAAATSPSLLDRSQLVFLVRSLIARTTSTGEKSIERRAEGLRSQAAALLMRDHKRLKDSARRRGHPSIVHPALEDAAAFCADHGCTLTVAALPIDVQVDASAWAKYGPPRNREDRNLAPTLKLLDDVVASARALGAEGIALHRVLSARPPGTAFLHDDDHLSPEGHAVVAETIRQALALAPAQETP